MRYVVGFARFWYDFIVGDSITLAVGGAAAIAGAAAFAAWGPAVVAEVGLPAAIVLVLTVSVIRR
jgi:hypothetical protein